MTNFVLIPAWSQVWTSEQAEKELANFKFKGPGLYLQDLEFLLVVAVEAEYEKVWRRADLWPKDTKFSFYQYDLPFYNSLFFVISTVVTRQDDRSY